LEFFRSKGILWSDVSGEPFENRRNRGKAIYPLQEMIGAFSWSPYNKTVKTYLKRRRGQIFAIACPLEGCY
jgi:hypothetical protein